MTKSDIHKKEIKQINTKKNYFTSSNFVKLAMIMFLMTFFGQLYVSNKLAVKSQNLVAYENEKAILEKELSEMKLELSYYSSLSYIEDKAKEQGFVENTEYISTITTNHTTARVN